MKLYHQRTLLRPHGLVDVQAQAAPPFDNVADLRKDPLVAWQHRYIHLIAVLVAFVLQPFANVF